MKEVRYFYVPRAAEKTELPQEEATHAIRALRLQAGDGIMLMDGEGTFFEAEISLVTNKKCMYQILSKLPQERIWKGKIHLAIAPTKMMERMEWLVEKATEIGFDELSFLSCRFSEREKVRVDRVEKIVISAVKQSRKAWMPKVNEMVSFRDFVTAERKGKKFICHCYEEFQKGMFFNELQKDSEEDVTVLIGPEGDFSIDEVRMALENDYLSVSLGNSRLRTETAGLVAVNMANIVKTQ